MAYNVRDILGHFVKPRSAEGEMCPHVCCRGERVHPDNMPVILPDKLLRRASDDDLAEHYGDLAHSRDPKAEEGRAQVLYEMQRRDTARERSRQIREGYDTAHAARRMERDAETERVYLDAEAYTRGNWTNRAGQARGISDRQILTGSDDLFARYASDEAKEYFSTHDRPTPAHFRGESTTYTPRYSAPRRRRQAGLPARPAYPSRARRARPPAGRTATRK